jgi:hypothetical protein
MAYVILKYIDGGDRTVVVNDSEGIAIEFETLAEAQKIADLFQNNTTHGSKYEVKKMV